MEVEVANGHANGDEDASLDTAVVGTSGAAEPAGVDANGQECEILRAFRAHNSYFLVRGSDFDGVATNLCCRSQTSIYPH